MKNIVLVGFMGTGKTVVAKALAKQLNMAYVSVDDLIEKKERKKISDIFAQQGEPYFRSIESQAIREACGIPGAVIDAGGGAVIKEENINNFKKNGVIVCLTAAPEIMLERTKGSSHRPLLNVEDPKANIERLLKARASCYAKADFTLNTSALSVKEVVEKIINYL